MKINGTNVKGIKTAIGNWNSSENKRGLTIIYDRKNKEVSTVAWLWYSENYKERLSDGYLRYENINDLLMDVYEVNSKPTMTNIQAVLREYVI